MFTLRSVTDEDAEFLYRTYASTREEELSVVPWSVEQKDAFLRSQFAAQDSHYRKHYHDAAYDVVLIDGEPAGRLYVARWAGEIRIMDISLLPAFRRRGAGEELLRAVFAEADRDGKLVSIHVEQQNPARRLYERLGFRAIEEGEPSVYVKMERAPARTSQAAG